jgi:hypothetical protein
VSTLQDLRDKIRLQTDLEDDDLPNEVADGFIREAFDRTFAVERKWPFFEYTWTLELADDATTLAMPTDPEVAFISRLRSPDGTVLLQIDQQTGEDNWEGDSSTSSDPEFFSVWANTISFWPTPTLEARTYTMRGYRRPQWSGVAGTELDGDDRLHQAMAWYAVSLVYAQLEDTELESQYMQRWQNVVTAFRRDLTRPDYHEPLILNGGLSRIARRSRYELDAP